MQEQATSRTLRGARLESVCQRPGTAVNVFIHGYSAAGTPARRKQLHEYIRHGGVSGHSYLLSWSAGDLRTPLTMPVWTRMLRLVRGGVLSPAGLLAEAATWGVAHVGHYKLIEQGARRLGRQLPVLLRAMPELQSGAPLNLIAHSVGAVVVAEALRSGAMNDLELQHCVLLGAAGAHDPEAWLEAMALLQGKLFHCYSRDDLALMLRPGMGAPLGRRALGLAHARALDIPLHGIGHRGYWPALARVLPRELRESGPPY